MLLLALTISDHQQAAEAIIHCWYSAFLRPADSQHIESLRPYVQDVCNKISDRRPGSLQAETFMFKRGSLRVILKKEAWKMLLGFISGSRALTFQQARGIRHAVTLAPQRTDHHDHSLLLQQPAHRICKRRFREGGILLPFGHPRDDFTIPNPYVEGNQILEENIANLSQALCTKTTSGRCRMPRIRSLVGSLHMFNELTPAMLPWTYTASYMCTSILVFSCSFNACRTLVSISRSATWMRPSYPRLLLQPSSHALMYGIIPKNHLSSR